MTACHNCLCILKQIFIFIFILISPSLSPSPCLSWRLFAADILQKALDSVEQNHDAVAQIGRHHGDVAAVVVVVVMVMIVCDNDGESGGNDSGNDGSYDGDC